jgi:hypothetical protein
MDIAALKQATQAAVTPGVWVVGETYVNAEPGEDGKPETVVRDISGAAGVAACLDFGPNNPTMRKANATYIAAANPVAILTLIASHEQLVAALQASRVYVSCAYECAFPDEQKNEMVLHDIAAALAAAGAA